MSESIHAGFLPLWNPYINYGLPQYADMNAGYWSPVTWLISSTIGYNAYTFTTELLLYILFGGLGIYKLTGLWDMGKPVRIIAGISFMCCGFNVGHLQHFNWLSGAALLPWCFWSYTLLITDKKIGNVITSALFFYLFVASAHPGLIIGAAYFFLGFFFYKCYDSYRHKTINLEAKRLLSAHVFFIIISMLFGAGIISGYLDVLPYFIRTDKISLHQSLSSPTTFQSWISMILPFATVKNDSFYNTDISMRNSYFSLTLLIFFLFACVQKKTSLQKYLFVSGILFALLSSGGIFKSMAYNTLPMIGYVRLNGEFRIFSLLSFILLSATELDKFFKAKKQLGSSLRAVIFTVALCLFAFVIFGFFKIITTKDSILYNIGELTTPVGFAAKMKNLIDLISFWDAIWIQGILQLTFLYLIYGALLKVNHQLLLKISIANLILSTLLNVPYTGAGKTSVKAIQNVINKSPEGIPLPSLHPINENDSLPFSEKILIGDWSFYNKQIGNVAEYPYPIVLKHLRQYYEDTTESKVNFEKAFLFVQSPTEGNSITLKNYSPNSLSINVVTDTAANLIIQQNYYPHWYYRTLAGTYHLDKKGTNFMALPLRKGSNDIEIKFMPKIVKYMMLLSLFSILSACCYLALKKIK